MKIEVGKYFYSAILVTGLVLSACSPAPDSVQPTPAPDAYASAPCRGLPDTIASLTAQEADLAAAQGRAFVADTVAVLIVGPPLGRMAGMNRASELAAVRGLLAAAQDRAEQCGRV